MQCPIFSQLKFNEVFELASVVVASEYLDALPVESVCKMQLLRDLVTPAHVDVKCDESGCTMLSGPWEHVVEAQLALKNFLSNSKKQVSYTEEVPETLPVITNYVKPYSSSKITPSALLRYYRSKYLNRQVRTQPKKRRIRYMSKTKHTNLRLEDTDKPSEKEVYVNITLTQPAKKCSEIVSVLNNIAIPLGSPAEKSGTITFPEDSENVSETVPDAGQTQDKKMPVPDQEAARVANRKKLKKDYEQLTPYKFFCHLCSFKTKRESHIRHHEELHEQASQLFFCDKCDFSTIRKGYLHRHKMTHSNVKYYCNLCHYFTDQIRFLSKHKRIKHENGKNQPSRKLLSCAECKYTTTRRHLMQRHIQTHEVASEARQHTFQCNQCSYRASRKEHYVRHVNNVHKNRRPFLCDNCGKAFKRADALKQHGAVHASCDSAAKCVVCGKVCRSQTQLNQHLAVHSNIRSFLCEICGAAFKTRAVQRTHVLTIHKNPKAYPCTHCPRKFNTKYALRRHTKQHSQAARAEREEGVERVAVASVPVGSDQPASQPEAFIIQEPVYAVSIGNSQPLAVQLISFV